MDDHTSNYSKRGVSATKSEVHEAIKDLDKGLYPMAFCKILPDIVGGDPAFCNVMHADTAGTKTALAYLYWKESGDSRIWEDISQDAIVMNVDDMACVGCVDKIILSSTIGRNKHLISAEVLKSLIQGNAAFVDKMNKLGLNLTLAGGETADVGDIVRTLDTGITAFCRIERSQLVVNNIEVGDVIVGLASDGQSTYETKYNSGIGSNGLTSARHDVLSSYYGDNFPESADPNTDASVKYIGSRRFSDLYEGHLVSALLLSPTRTYLPVIKEVLKKYHADINGMIHNTGGGQTKVLKFIENKSIVKDNVFEIPPIFRLIQEESNASWKEMYQVFNMGHRLEIYTSADIAQDIIDLSRTFNIEAQVVGHVQDGVGQSLLIKSSRGAFEYS